jgi:hypothetical protein
LSPS